MHSLEPTEDFAIVLVRRFLRLCEHPRTRARMLRMIRNATKHGEDSPRLYRWINRVVLHPAAPARMRSMSAMKAELVAAQLVGLAMVRYVLEVEPLASAPVEEVIRLAAPAVAAALQGEDAFSGLVEAQPDVADDEVEGTRR